MGSNLNWRKEDISLEVQKRMIIGEITGKKKNKLNARITIVDNIKFQSEKEANFYRELKQDSNVLFFLRQVPLRFKSGLTYWVDFLVFYRDGSYKFVEVKGFKTRVYKMKRKLVESEYPDIKVEEI